MLGACGAYRTRGDATALEKLRALPAMGTLTISFRFSIGGLLLSEKGELHSRVHDTPVDEIPPTAPSTVAV
jgi:hypothetical protein